MAYENMPPRAAGNWHLRPSQEPQAQRPCFCGAKVGQVCNGTVGDFHWAR